jgi:hypothetical protein
MEIESPKQSSKEDLVDELTTTLQKFIDKKYLHNKPKDFDSPFGA